MEVVLEVMRIILQYFGWNRDEIEELIDRHSQPRGYRRSVVRRIGRQLPLTRVKFFTRRSIVREIASWLPLKPCKRPYFQITINENEQESDSEIEGKPLTQMLMASLADVGWITGGDGLLSHQSNESAVEKIETQAKQLPASEVEENKDYNLTSNCEALQKISALEDELQRLRAQIAMMLVNTPPQIQGQLINTTPTTPMGAPVPPPPPPPPPPTPQSTIKPISQIIKENRAKRLSIAPGALIDDATGCSVSIPNMSEVLKGLGNVKLRSIERSPGGTPLRKPPLQTDGTDPASIIAQALKKKFAHRRRLEANSPDANKENTSPSPPFGTPPSSPIKSVAVFGPHLLKPSKSRRRSSTSLKRPPLLEVC